MPARAIPRASTQKQSNTTLAEKACVQTVEPMAVEKGGRARHLEIAAIRARKPTGAHRAKSRRERTSSAAGAGSCGQSTSHDRRQPVAILTPPRLKTLPKRN